ncbi:MAG: LuxR C-terminal-related transcriptional regulator [Bellilinea sp.]|nr:LuxR C-terminal-related transcriptional regulator [Bellilinea sp.]
MTWIICLIEEKIQFLAQDERRAEELSALLQRGEWLPRPLIETLRKKSAWQAVAVGEGLLMVFPQQERRSVPKVCPECPPLTPRQQAILQLLTEGLTAKQIAAQMGLSRRTVFLHLAAIRQRLGVSSTLQAVWKIGGRDWRSRKG